MAIAHKPEDIIGLVFGRLSVIDDLGRDYLSKGGRRWVVVICECGEVKQMRLDHLTNNNTVSCGCHHREQFGKSRLKHGLYNHRLYFVWMGMKTRCYKPRCSAYHHYGGRGIKICVKWRNDFMSFYKWAINNGWERGLQIDRINVNKGYSPNNCRIATIKQQARNKRTNLLFTINGETKCLKDWVETGDIKYRTVICRVKSGWSIEEALTKKIKPNDLRRKV